MNFGVLSFLFGGGPGGRVGFLLVDLFDGGSIFGHGRGGAVAVVDDELLGGRGGHILVGP